jgi:hypothetical protein
MDVIDMRVLGGEGVTSQIFAVPFDNNHSSPSDGFLLQAIFLVMIAHSEPYEVTISCINPAPSDVTLPSVGFHQSGVTFTSNETMVLETPLLLISGETFLTIEIASARCLVRFFGQYVKVSQVNGAISSFDVFIEPEITVG